MKRARGATHRPRRPRAVLPQVRRGPPRCTLQCPVTTDPDVPRVPLVAGAWRANPPCSAAGVAGEAEEPSGFTVTEVTVPFTLFFSTDPIVFRAFRVARALAAART